MGSSYRSLEKRTESRTGEAAGVRIDVAGLGITLGFELGCLGG